MVVEYIIAFFHYFKEFRTAVFYLGKIISDALTEMIVRTCKIVSVIAVLYDKTVTVADTRVEFSCFVSESLLKCLNEHVCFLCGDLICAVVEDNSVLIGYTLVIGNRYDVASVSCLVSRHVDSDADSLKGRAPLGEYLGVI